MLGCWHSFYLFCWLRLFRQKLVKYSRQNMVAISRRQQRDQIVFWLSQFKHLDLENIRAQKQIIDCFVNTVYLFDDQLVVNFNFDRERRKISRAEVEAKLTGVPHKADAAPKRTEPDLFFYGDGFGVLMHYNDIA